MNEQETAKIIGSIKIAYPYYYKDYDDENLIASISLWHTQFKKADFRSVNNALHFYVSSGKYPPSPADIKEILYEHSECSGFPNNEEAWGLVLRAGRNARYNAREEIEKLPDIIKEAVSIELLRRIADSTEYNQESIKKNFLDEYEKIKQQNKKSYQIAMMSDSVKLIGSVSTMSLTTKDHDS